MVHTTYSEFTKAVARGLSSSEYLRQSREACDEDARDKRPVLSYEDRLDMRIRQFLERQAGQEVRVAV
jgi:hypothetical protein